MNISVFEFQGNKYPVSYSNDSVYTYALVNINGIPIKGRGDDRTDAYLDLPVKCHQTITLPTLLQDDKTKLELEK